MPKARLQQSDLIAIAAARKEGKSWSTLAQTYGLTIDGLRGTMGRRWRNQKRQRIEQSFLARPQEALDSASNSGHSAISDAALIDTSAVARNTPKTAIKANSASSTADAALESWYADDEAEMDAAWLAQTAEEDARLLRRHLDTLAYLGDPYAVYCIYDLHLPDHDQRAFDLHLQLIARIQPAVIVFGGDAFEFGELSRFPSRSRGGKIDAFGAVRSLWVKAIAALRTASPKSRIVFMGGNHDARADLYMAEHPEFAETLESAFVSLVRQDGQVLWMNWKEELEFPHTILQHGERTNKHAAMSAMEDTGGYMTVVSGHVHRYTKWAKTTRMPEGHRRIVISVTAPCSCRIPPQYRRKSKSDTANWIQGAVSLVINPSGDDVHVQEYVYHRLRDGRLSTVYGSEYLTSTTALDSD